MVINPMHRAIFPNFLVAKGFFCGAEVQHIAGRLLLRRWPWQIDHRPGRDLFLIDDPLKDADEARSEMIRRSMRDWYTQGVRTRLHRGGAIVIVQTRWHEDERRLVCATTRTRTGTSCHCRQSPSRMKYSAAKARPSGPRAIH